MTSSPAEPTGLRERKKAKTRAAIQRHALRLFHEQGYGATTVDQIAAAAEISPSTFFRYFATKEAAALYDPLFIEAAVAQPAELALIPAMRATVSAVLAQLSEEELERVRQRQLLVFRETDLRAAMTDQFAAVVGVLPAAFLEAAGDPGSDYLVVLDRALAHLGDGLPL